MTTFAQLAEQIQRSMAILEEINSPKPQPKKTVVKVGGLTIIVEVEQ